MARRIGLGLQGLTPPPGAPQDAGNEIGCLAVDKSEAVPFAGVKLHLETDRIAVWEEHFAPRQATEAHRHSRDYIAIALTDVDLTVEPLTGEQPEELTVLVPQERMSLEGNRGKLPRGVVFHSAVSSDGAAHIAFNNSDQLTKLLIIEFKGTGAEALETERVSGVELATAIDPRLILLANFGIAAATGLTAVLCQVVAFPIWSVLLGAVIFFSNGFRLRDGAVTFVCLAIGTLLSAGAGLAIQLIPPQLAQAAPPMVIFALTFLVLSFRLIPVFNNLLAYYIGLIQFVASGRPPTAASVALLVAASALGGVLAIASFLLERRVCRLRWGDPVSRRAGSGNP